jgi:hypothetical protein
MDYNASIRKLRHTLNKLDHKLTNSARDKATLEDPTNSKEVEEVDLIELHCQIIHALCILDTFDKSEDLPNPRTSVPAQLEVLKARLAEGGPLTREVVNELVEDAESVIRKQRDTEYPITIELVS